MNRPHEKSEYRKMSITMHNQHESANAVRISEKTLGQVVDDITILALVATIGYYFLVNYLSKTQYAEGFASLTSLLRLSTVVLSVIVVLYKMLFERGVFPFVAAFFVMSAMLTMMNYFLFPETRVVFSDTVSVFYGTVIRIAILFYVIDDVSSLLKALRIYALIVSMILLYSLFFRGQAFNDGRYSMTLSFICLLPAAILLLSFRNNHQPIDLLGAIVIVAAIIAFGSRGSLLALALYVVLGLFRRAKVQHIIIAVIVLLLIYCSLPSMISLLVNSSSIFAQSRTVQYMLGGYLYEDSGRSLLYVSVLNELGHHPFAVRGINSDYLLLGVYTHNIVLEILYEFGCLLGGFICLDLLFRVINTFIKADDSSESELCLLLMFASIPSLMLSHSLWAEWTFWAWICIYIRLYGHGLLNEFFKAQRGESVKGNDIHRPAFVKGRR